MLLSGKMDAALAHVLALITSTKTDRTCGSEVLSFGAIQPAHVEPLYQMDKSAGFQKADLGRLFLSGGLTAYLQFNGPTG